MFHHVPVSRLSMPQVQPSSHPNTSFDPSTPTADSKNSESMPPFSKSPEVDQHKINLQGLSTPDILRNGTVPQKRDNRVVPEPIPGETKKTDVPK